ncbi:MAG: site-2 protease family protein [Patescibacteria group bacterium]|nr:site-2 protease family protein [Patescibacteria group bacterium]
MLFNLLFSSPIVFLILASILVFSITIHEFAHALMADRLGDPTPRYKGRVSLNPLHHLDPIGTLAILLVGFGWGKPVPYDPYNLKNPVPDAAKIALAGPAINLVIAGLAGLVLNFFSPIPLLQVLLPTAIYLNVMLAVFNLLPVAPLDGSKVITAILPRQTALEYQDFMRRYGIWVLLFLILPIGGRSAISSLILPIINWLVNILV